MPGTRGWSIHSGTEPIVKRIDIYYGGEHYSVGGRELADLQSEVALGLSHGSAWLAVNEGEGAPRTAYLLLSPGVPLTIVPVPAEEPAGSERS